jgi:hypothetical protein
MAAIGEMESIVAQYEMFAVWLRTILHRDRDRDQRPAGQPGAATTVTTNG